MTENNPFKVGYWRVKNGVTPEWVTSESESVRFTNYLVRDIDHLRTSISDRYAENIGDNCTTQ